MILASTKSHTSLAVSETTSQTSSATSPTDSNTSPTKSAVSSTMSTTTLISHLPSYQMAYVIAAMPLEQAEQALA